MILLKDRGLIILKIKFPICDVSVLSSYKNNAVVIHEPLTGSGSVNRVNDDTISISFPSTDYQNSNSNIIEMAEVAKKAFKHPFDTLSNINISEDTILNKTSKVVSKFS